MDKDTKAHATAPTGPHYTTNRTHEAGNQAARVTFCTLTYGMGPPGPVVHGALRKRVWVVIVSSCATRRLRKAVVLVGLLGGTPPSTASRRAPLGGFGGGAKSRNLKTADSSMTDHTNQPDRHAKLCQEKPSVMLGSCTIKISSLAAKKDKSWRDLAILASHVPIPKSRTSRAIQA